MAEPFSPIAAEHRVMSLKLVMALAAIAVLIGIVTTFRTWRWLGSAIRTEGRIVELLEDHSDEGVTYRAVFEFLDASGRTQRVRSHYGGRSPIGEVGQRVPVLYRPEQPDSAEIDDFISIWAMSLAFLGIGGAIFTVCCAKVALLTRRIRQFEASRGLETIAR